MALIKCSECGKEFSDKADKCPNCGCPNSNIETKTVIVDKPKGVWSAGRLTIGIISIVMFPLISLQACAAGLGNALAENNSSSGTAGVILAFFLLIAGIIGICTRNSKSKLGAEIATVIYWLAASITVGTGETYPDLPIWGAISFFFGIVFLIASIKTKKSS